MNNYRIVRVSRGSILQKQCEDKWEGKNIWAGLEITTDFWGTIKGVEKWVQPEYQMKRCVLSPRKAEKILLKLQTIEKTREEDEEKLLAFDVGNVL